MRSSDLAYLFSLRLSQLLEVNYDKRPTRMILGGRQTEQSDQEHLQRFSGILLGLPMGGWR